MKDLLALAFGTLGNRVIAAGVAGAASWASRKYGVVVDPSALTSLTLGVYGAVHSILQRWQGK